MAALAILHSPLLTLNFFRSVNAKVLAHGRASSSRPFKPGLVGAGPTTDANLWLNPNCPRSSDRLERGSAKAEAAGAIPAVDAISQDCGVTSSISPCEGDGPGANPGFLTISS
jgi:hypothetical protein